MKEFTIRETSDLRLLLARDDVRFLMAIPALGNENEAWERRLRADHAECGCEAAAMGLLAGILLGASGAWLGSLPWWQVMLIGIGAGALISGVAKVIRQRVANANLLRTVESIEERILQET